MQKTGLLAKSDFFFFSPKHTVYQQNFARVNRIWPTAVAGEADSVSSVPASACHIGGPNSVNPGQILLVYGTLN